MSAATACTCSPDCHGTNSAERFTRPLVALLQQLADVVAALRDEHYIQKPVGVVDSSIGGHVRHCLDHVRALLGAIDTGELDYDHRARGTPIERSRYAAVEEARELVTKLLHLTRDDVEQVISMRVLMSAGDESIGVMSTIGREMAYTLSHTIHHNALIGTMVKTLGGWLPDKFGYAPATERHRNQEPAIRSH